MQSIRKRYMALVTGVQLDDKPVNRLHPTRLVCWYLVGSPDGQRILQLDTYGSADRKDPDKLSQTLQFDERSAKQLFDVIQKEFGF